MKTPASITGHRPAGAWDQDARRHLLRPTREPGSLTRARTRAADGTSALDLGWLGGGGQPLDASTRADMASRFGFDFGRVRIHVGPDAAEANRRLRASAFTVGWHIAFGEGQYAPGTHGGRRLLAHELTHALQQTGSAVEPRRAGGAASLPRAHPATPRIQRAGGEPDLGNLPPLERPEDKGECVETIAGGDIEAKSQQAGTISVIEISSERCGPCKLLRNVLNEVCHDWKERTDPFQYRFYEVNRDESPATRAMLEAKYGDVSATPVALFVAGGQILKRLEGLMPQADVELALTAVAEAAAAAQRRQERKEKEPAIQRQAASDPGQMPGYASAPAMSGDALRISHPEDREEQEAERIAEAVTSGPVPCADERTSGLAAAPSGTIWRQPNSDDEPTDLRAAPPLSVNQIDLIDSPSGAVDGFGDVQGISNLNRPGPYDDGREVLNAHQVVFHLAQGTVDRVFPRRVVEAARHSRAGREWPVREKLKLEQQMPRLGAGMGMPDGPGEHEFKRIPPDTLAVADAPGPWGLHERDFPVVFEATFKLALHEMLVKDSPYLFTYVESLPDRQLGDTEVASIRYKVEITKAARDEPASPNHVVRL